MNKEQQIIEEITSKYGDKIKEMNIRFFESSKKFDVNELIKIIERQRLLIKKIIIDISKNYQELKEADFIMFNGSFSRHSNIVSSDLDLNIMYDNKLRSILLPVELSINYILSKILKFKGCDRIHSIMVYTPLIGDNHPKLIDNKKINYEFGENLYYCRENYQQLLFETCNSSRDYKILLNYISNSNNTCLEEWETNFELIIDYGKYNIFDRQISKIRSKKLQNTDINILVNNIDNIIRIIEEFKYLDNTEIIYIKDLKKIIKTIPLTIIYKSLVIINIKENGLIKLDKLYSDLMLKDLITSIYFYLWILLRVEIVFENIGYDLSSHSSVEIKVETLKNVYKEIYHDDIIKNINNSVNKVFVELKKSLVKFREKLNGKYNSNNNAN